MTNSDSPPKRRGRKPKFNGELGPAKNSYAVSSASVLLAIDDNNLTKIDKADFPAVSRYSWTTYRASAGLVYARAYVADWPTKSRRPLLHQFIMRPRAGYVVDHADGDGLNNTRGNLREVTYRKNALNNPVFRERQKQPAAPADLSARQRDFPDGAPDRQSLATIPEELYRLFQLAAGIEDWVKATWKAYGRGKQCEILAGYHIRPPAKFGAPPATPAAPVRAVRMASQSWQAGDVSRFDIRQWIGRTLRAWLARLLRHMVRQSPGRHLTRADFYCRETFGCTLWHGFQPEPREIAGAMQQAFRTRPGNVWHDGTCCRGYPGFDLRGY